MPSAKNEEERERVGVPVEKLINFGHLDDDLWFPPPEVPRP